MRHLKAFKVFEKLGINFDMEDQVDKYMNTILNSSELTFNFLYKCNIGNRYFKVIIDKDLDCRGEFLPDDMIIKLRDRNFRSTLLHEVKHLDYNMRVKGSLTDIYFRANNLTQKVPTIEKFAFIFYSFTEDEFQAKYNSYYKDFDIHLSKMENVKSVDILSEFDRFLASHKDATWNWYFSTNEFKFRNYLTESQLKTLFKKVINPIIDNKGGNYTSDILNYRSNNSDDIDLTYLSIYHMLTSYWKKLKEFFLGKEAIKMSSEDETKMNKNLKMLERNINFKKVKYRKRIERIITLMVDKYVK